MNQPNRRNRFASKRSLTVLAVAAPVLAACSAMMSSGPANAHHPDYENRPATPRIDVIGPLGNNLPPGHRRKYNRPGYLMGKLAYHTAPSSQEAMSWHRAVHAGAYKSPKKCLRLEQHYFYPKPYDALTIGPRRAAAQAGSEQVLVEPVPMTDADELEVDSLPTPGVEDVHEPNVDVQELLDEDELELPKIDLSDEAASPSDVLMIEPAFGMLNESDFQTGKHIQTAAGKSDETQVSRAAETAKQLSLDVADKPIFFRRWLDR